MLFENIKFEAFEAIKIKNWNSKIILLVSEKKIIQSWIKSIDKLMKGNLRRIISSEKFKNLSNGESLVVAFPFGLNCIEFHIIKVSEDDCRTNYRVVGGAIANSIKNDDILLISQQKVEISEILYGFFLKAYRFNKYKNRNEDVLQKIMVLSSKFKKEKKNFEFYKSLLNGIYFCRDLTNEPANILNTIEFTKRLIALESFGLQVEVLDEEKLNQLGMRALLAVGQGSEYPARVIVLRWQGLKVCEKPLLLVGKGVTFDSGGISLKPASGMDEMIMDMSGAGIVAGIMKTLALRQASTNVVGLIGLVENMPDGKAQRPGDIVKTMKGDTVEVLNTDAEGRLVLCDLLWFAQTHFSPKAIIDLATLTGAIITALGNINAGLFSNNNDISRNFLESAQVEGEGAWRLPLNPDYQKLLQSRVADIANVGGRAAGAITAAQFLQTFVKDDMPWIHLDVAGVSFIKKSSKLSSGGATGWGVATLNRFIYDYFEKISGCDG